MTGVQTCALPISDLNGLAGFFPDELHLNHPAVLDAEKAITSLQQAIASLQQEPVAWMYPDDLKRFETNETFAQAFSIKVASPIAGETVPLYTHPPKREWQGLTDELMYQLANQVGFDAELMQRNHDKGIPSIAELFAKAIDTKLKSKNHG